MWCVVYRIGKICQKVLLKEVGTGSAKNADLISRQIWGRNKNHRFGWKNSNFIFCFNFSHCTFEKKGAQQENYCKNHLTTYFDLLQSYGSLSKTLLLLHFYYCYFIAITKIGFYLNRFFVPTEQTFITNTCLLLFANQI